MPRRNLPFFRRFPNDSWRTVQADPRIGIRADNGRFHGTRGFHSTAHATRGSVAKTPYFSRNISCLTLILGESGDLGGNPGWDGNGEMATIPNDFRESS